MSDIANEMWVVLEVIIHWPSRPPKKPNKVQILHLMRETPFIFMPSIACLGGLLFIGKLAENLPIWAKITKGYKIRGADHEIEASGPQCWVSGTISQYQGWEGILLSTILSMVMAQPDDLLQTTPLSTASLSVDHFFNWNHPCPNSSQPLTAWLISCANRNLQILFRSGLSEQFLRKTRLPLPYKYILYKKREPPDKAFSFFPNPKTVFRSSGLKMLLFQWNSPFF